MSNLIQKAKQIIDNWTERYQTSDALIEFLFNWGYSQTCLNPVEAPQFTDKQFIKESAMLSEYLHEAMLSDTPLALVSVLSEYGIDSFDSREASFSQYESFQYITIVFDDFGNGETLLQVLSDRLSSAHENNESVELYIESNSPMNAVISLIQTMYIIAYIDQRSAASSKPQVLAVVQGDQECAISKAYSYMTRSDDFEDATRH
ncbi:hypothetical protein [Vibrio chaetopteri]|uniref:Uncharacterized protein n=1 Tax=Vibrio chaetopteri TaxID=3016528 RepID=A0AAU8BRZ6_9VIBR